MDQIFEQVLYYLNASLVVGLLAGYLAIRKRGAAVFIALMYVAVVLVESNAARARLTKEDFIALAAGCVLGLLAAKAERLLTRR